MLAACLKGRQKRGQEGNWGIGVRKCSWVNQGVEIKGGVLCNR